MKESAWCVVQNNRGKYLVLKRSKLVRNSGLWNFPGGGVDEGERPLESAKREFHEECGLTISNWVHIFSLTKDDKRLHYYRPAAISPIKEVFINGESSEYKWASPKKLEELNLHQPTFLYVKAVNEHENKRYRKELVRSDLFLNVLGKFDNGDAFGQATICVPTRKLHNFQIFPQYRGWGLSHKLMSHIMKMSHHPLTLTANPEHNALPVNVLVSFYRKYGFEPTEVSSSLFGHVRMAYKGVKQDGSR